MIKKTFFGVRLLIMWYNYIIRKIQFYHLKNLGKKKFSVTVINVFGEWDKYIDFLNQLDVDIINLNLKKTYLSKK